MISIGMNSIVESTRQIQLRLTVKDFLSSPAWTRLIALLVLCALVALTTPTFLHSQNIINMIRQASLILIMAIGMTTVVLTGGIDLSMGSVLTLSSVTGALVLKQEDLPIWIGIAAGLSD